MSKIYDISSKLTTENPTLKINKDLVFEVNTEKSIMLQVSEIQKNPDKYENADGEMQKLLLGEENAKKLEEHLAGTPGYGENHQTIMIALMAAAQNIPFEVMKQRFQNATKEQ